MEQQSLRLFQAIFPGRQAVETSSSLSTAAPHRLLPTEPKMLRTAPDPPTGPTFYCQGAYR